MKERLHLIVILFVCFAGSIFSQSHNNIFQYSVISALMEGNYDGDFKISELKDKGDFGLGTLNSLDGELVILDGKFYQITSEGKVNRVSDETIVPFAVITSFNSLKNETPAEAKTLAELITFLDQHISSRNLIYAIRISGSFGYLKTRSVPAQQKPYKRLVDVTKNQSEFEFENIKGTIAGFRFPEFMDGVNVPGYHFHFISEDKTSGGHVLDLKSENILIEIAEAENFTIEFPGTAEYLQIDLSKRNSQDLMEAEK